MMRNLFLALLFAIPLYAAPAESENVLLYRQPAAKWNEALPVGNGRLGAMVFGGVQEEHLQLNEDTVWAGEKRDRINPEGATNIPVIRKLLADGKPKEAEALADKTVIAIPRRMPQYQTLGDLMIHFQESGTVSDYRRSLDLDTAISRVTYRSGDALFTREVFASAVDQVIVVRLTCDRPRQLSFSASLTRQMDAKTHASGDDRISMEGEAIAHDNAHTDERKVGVKFQAVLMAVQEGGRVRTDGDRLIVEGADSVTLMLAAATDFREKDPAAKCQAYLKSAKKPYDQLRAAHLADHRKFFRRVSLNLAGTAPDLPTDERLKRVQDGSSDPQLATLYFQYGRYLLISSSRPWTMAATLQGIWNDQLAPPWDSKYTININTEMNYWPAEVCNLSELHEPLFDLIDGARPEGRRVAKVLYGARGFVIHHNTDIWGDAVPIDGPRSGLWPTGGAWLSLHLWDHYEYTHDKNFLRQRAYPVLKEAAEFLLDYLVDDGKGNLVTGPSVSPENRYGMADGTVGSVCMGPYMDTEITRALFCDVIAASELLGIDSDLRQRLTAARLRLPAFKIGKYGRLQEWLEDYDDVEPGHRHISHLFALHPGNQITPRGTPELAQAARITLERRLAAGGGYTGWSRAWIINFWARLEQGDLAYENLQALFKKSTLPNLLDTHPPFQIDGNFGATAAIAEMIMQSHAGEISFLPALPAAWPDGSVTGLVARGAVELDVYWQSSKVSRVVLRPRIDGEQTFRAPRGQKIASITSNGKPVKISESETGQTAVRSALKTGNKYTILFR